jgi:hypothetical protein
MTSEACAKRTAGTQNPSFLTVPDDGDSLPYSRYDDGFAGDLRPAKENLALAARLPKRDIIGGLAQLGERLAGSQKVRGSNPLSSTSQITTTGTLAIFSAKPKSAVVGRKLLRLGSSSCCAAFCAAFCTATVPLFSAVSKWSSVVIR